MADRTAPKSPPRVAPKSKSSPLIRSSVILRGVATAVTLTSLGGMTAFAATHVQNATAPLQPSASTTAVATPAPTSRTATTTRRSTTLTGGVTTTTTPARTKTKRS